MPDVTISFTYAQWTRIVASSSTIKQVDESGDIDANYISTRLKTLVTSWVKEHEEKATVEDF